MNLPQSLVIMLARLNFLILFVQRYKPTMCSHPRLLQHTSPPYLGLDAHFTHMPQLQTCLSTLTKKRRSPTAPFVFSCQAPCQASFRPLPLGLKLFVVIGLKVLARSYDCTTVHWTDHTMFRALATTVFSSSRQ